MCFQYLNKFFGTNRRRSNAANGGVSPRPSLANAPQVSIETVRTVKSAKSIKSSSASAAGKRGVNVVNNNTVVNVTNNKMGQSMNSLRLERRQSVAAGSGAGAIGNNATAAVPSTAAANATAVATAGSSSAAVSGAGDNGSPGKRSSWWGFFGIGKKKSRSSRDSI